MVVSTYQAASGAGAAAMEELELQTREVCILFLVIYLFYLFRYNDFRLRFLESTLIN